MAKIRITSERNYTVNGFIDFRTYTNKECHNQTTFSEEKCYKQIHEVDENLKKDVKIELDAFKGISHIRNCF